MWSQGDKIVVTSSRFLHGDPRGAGEASTKTRASSGGLRFRKETFEAEWPTYLTIEKTPALCRQAGEFAEHYQLRAYDSLHLAAFAEVSREAGVRDTRFSSFDRALNRATRSLRRTLTRAR